MGQRGDEDGDHADRHPKGIFIRMSAGTAGSAGGALSGGFSALDAVFNPAAARATEERERQHEAVIPTPSPGDKLLEEGRVIISLPQDPDDTSQ